MVKRKFFTTLLATPISLLFIFAVFFGEWKQPFELLVMTGMYSLIFSPYVILYGVPVTFLSDYVAKRLTGNMRVLVAFTFHFIFGILFGIIFPFDVSFSLFGAEIDLAIISASITALFFWAIDELLRKNRIQKKLYSKCCLNFAK
jgi:hypothetical protein